ncbi:hypothetical protein [Nocardiopsis changdeensis]|uniref:hypothetical protein n=1 Tax=Nocardiopsis changdeensis TaxID=2831969 RepID=UPI003F448BC1
MSSGVGMDPSEGYTGGGASLIAASRLRDLPLDWSETISAVSEIMKSPPVVTGWTKFGSEQEEHMQEVQEHAKRLAENIQSASSEGARTDTDSSEGYRFATDEGVLSRPLNVEVY